MRSLSFAILFGMTSLTAHAAENLSWDLSGQSVRYRIQTDIESPLPIPLMAKRNMEFKSNHIQVTVDTGCEQAVARGKKAWEVTCTVQDLSLRAGLSSGNEASASAILNEWVTDLKGATLQIVLSTTGTVRTVDLDNGDQSNQREADIHGIQEMILARVYMGLDAQLPKDGSDQGLGQWTIKRANTMGTPSRDGVLGSIRGQAKITKSVGGQVWVENEARGVRQTGSVIAGLLGIVYDMTLADNYVFDTTLQQLATRNYLVRGVPTPSSGVNPKLQYIQQGIIERLEDQESVNLGVTSLYPTSVWLPFVDAQALPAMVQLD